MFPKAIPSGLFVIVATLGAPGAAISGGGEGDGAQRLPNAPITGPVTVLPHAQQTRSPSLVTQVAPAPGAQARVASATRQTAPIRSKIASDAPASKLPKETTSAQSVNGPTSWAALNQAIARIPDYRSGVATWVVTSRYGHWGATDLANGSIYLSPNVPAAKVHSVASHEYAHALAFYNYGWNQQAANAALNRWFGGGDVAARERAADCMAIAQGATWTNYTSCQNELWRQGARILLAGKRLP